MKMNPMAMMKGQLAKLSSIMTLVYAKLDAESVTGSAADGKVTANGNGRGKLLSLDIAADLVAAAAGGSEARELMEDAIVAAVADMTAKAKIIQDAATKKHTGVALPKNVELPMLV